MSEEQKRSEEHPQPESATESASEPESEPASASESESESASASESESATEPELGDILDARPLKTTGEYPEADERELRMAGMGCIGLVVAAALTIGIVFALAFQSIDDLGGGSATATVVSEAQPQDSPEVRSTPASRPEPQVDWLEPGEGRERAEEERRPMVVLFEAEWASASRDMREGTFEDPAVVAAVAPFVAVRVDMASAAPEAVALREEHEVSFVPHVLFLDPEGEELRPAVEGLLAPDDLRVLLVDALAVHRERALRQREASARDEDEPTPSPATPASAERP